MTIFCTTRAFSNDYQCNATFRKDKLNQTIPRRYTFGLPKIAKIRYKHGRYHPCKQVEL